MVATFAVVLLAAAAGLVAADAEGIDAIHYTTASPAICEPSRSPHKFARFMAQFRDVIEVPHNSNESCPADTQYILETPSPKPHAYAMLLSDCNVPEPIDNIDRNCSMQCNTTIPIHPVYSIDHPVYSCEYYGMQYTKIPPVVSSSELVVKPLPIPDDMPPTRYAQLVSFWSVDCDPTTVSRIDIIPIWDKQVQFKSNSMSINITAMTNVQFLGETNLNLEISFNIDPNAKHLNSKAGNSSSHHMEKLPSVCTPGRLIHANTVASDGSRQLLGMFTAEQVDEMPGNPITNDPRKDDWSDNSDNSDNSDKATNKNSGIANTVRFPAIVMATATVMLAITFF